MLIIDPRRDAVPPLDLSQLFIVIATEGDEEPRAAVCTLEAAPVDAFNAWLGDILATEDGEDALFHFVASLHRETWDALSRLWVLTDLRIRSIDISKYTYACREEAEKARMAQWPSTSVL
jgi:hypothetical protein